MITQKNKKGLWHIYIYNGLSHENLQFNVTVKMSEVRLDKTLMFSMCMDEYVENEGTREREQTHEQE